MTDENDDDSDIDDGAGSGRHPSAEPAPLRAVPADRSDRSGPSGQSGRSGRSRTGRDPGDDPGSARLFVAVGDRPARWYRVAAEAVADARPLVDGSSPGDVVARAWTAEPAEGPPVWQLRRGPRRRLRWERPGGGPGGGPTPGSA